MGYESGHHIATHLEMRKYYDALSAYAPNRVMAFEYGRSWEGRKLICVVIGSEANMRRLPE